MLTRARDGGAEIVSLLKTSSAYYAPASGVVQMLGAILRDEHRILPGCAWLQGEYGLKDVCLGVPVELAASGVVRVVEQTLSPQAREALHAAAEQIRRGVAQIMSPVKAAL